MGLKVPKQEVDVKHLVLAGTVEELDKHLSENYLSGGWRLVTAHMLVNDRYNHVVEVFYVLSKEKPLKDA